MTGDDSHADSSDELKELSLAPESKREERQQQQLIHPAALIVPDDYFDCSTVRLSKGSINNKIGNDA